MLHEAGKYACAPRVDVLRATLNGAPQRLSCCPPTVRARALVTLAVDTSLVGIPITQAPLTTLHDGCLTPGMAAAIGRTLQVLTCAFRSLVLSVTDTAVRNTKNPYVNCAQASPSHVVSFVNRERGGGGDGGAYREAGGLGGGGGG